MKKIVFLQSNSEWFPEIPRWELFPYGLALIAAILEKDYEVVIIDCNIERLSLDQAVARVVAEQPDYIGVTCLAVEYSIHAHTLIGLLRGKFPKAPIILGGVYCTLMPEVAMRDTNIDYCVLGEGEPVIPQLLACLDAGKPVDGIREGIAFFKDGKPVIRSQFTFLNGDQLDALPFPAYHKTLYDKYGVVNVKFSFADTRDDIPVAKLYTSRGCPAGCNFCAVEAIAGKKFRYRSIENVLDEMQFLIDTYGTKEFVFYDDNLIFERKRAKDLFRGIIQRKFNIKWKPANISVFSMDEEMLDLMKESGCTMLVFAVESAVDRVLHKIITKPLKIERAMPIIQYAKKLDFRCAGLYVIGNPGETWDEIHTTLRFADETGIYSHFSIATPLPKTKLYTEAVEKKLLTSDFSFAAGAGCSAGWMVTEEFTPFDLEMLRLYEWDRVNFSTPEKRQRSADFFKLTIPEIEKFARGARINMHKKYVQDPDRQLRERPVDTDDIFAAVAS